MATKEKKLFNVDPEDRYLWGAALGTFLVGDVVTTTIGLKNPDVYEAHPLSSMVIGSAGVTGMLAAKTVVFGATYGVYRQFDEEINGVIPLTLTLMGSGIVLNNLAVIINSGD